MKTEEIYLKALKDIQDICFPILDSGKYDTSHSQIAEIASEAIRNVKFEPNSVAKNEPEVLRLKAHDLITAEYPLNKLYLEIEKITNSDLANVKGFIHGLDACYPLAKKLIVAKNFNLGYNFIDFRYVSKDFIEHFFKSFTSASYTLKCEDCGKFNCLNEYAEHEQPEIQ